jgi:effector-binding domain-containing protein
MSIQFLTIDELTTIGAAALISYYSPVKLEIMINDLFHYSNINAQAYNGRYLCGTQQEVKAHDRHDIRRALNKRMMAQDYDLEAAINYAELLSYCCQSSKVSEDQWSFVLRFENKCLSGINQHLFSRFQQLAAAS